MFGKFEVMLQYLSVPEWSVPLGSPTHPFSPWQRIVNMWIVHVYMASIKAEDDKWSEKS